jgi:Matrixin
MFEVEPTAAPPGTLLRGAASLESAASNRVSSQSVLTLLLASLFRYRQDRPRPAVRGAMRVSAALLALSLLAVAPGRGADKKIMDWQLKPLEIDGPIPYFIAPGLLELGYRPQDAQLAEWALAAWSRATDGVLCFYPAEGTKALLRIYWSPVRDGLYGQMQAIPVDKRRGGEVYVRPRLDELESKFRDVAERAEGDPIFRDAVVYLTLVHEIGHVLGLVHSPEMNDAMYYGGDPLGYFTNYRSQIRKRTDIMRFPGLSATDLRRVRRMYPPTLWLRQKAEAAAKQKPAGQGAGKRR